VRDFAGGIAVKLLVLLTQPVGQGEKRLIPVVGRGCRAIAVQPGCDLFGFEVVGLAATKGGADDFSFRLVVAKVLVMLDVFQDIIDQLG
jgi:hypothetical protein